MSMTAYTGLPGAGKSYEVVNGPILRAATKGRPVWTNIPVTIPGVTVVDPLKVGWYLEAPAGALIVVDECWRYWPSGAKGDLDENIKEWFAMHRHRTGSGLDGQVLSTDIILVTQDLSQVANFVRQLVSKTYRMRKLTALGSKTRYRVDVYEGAVTGQRPPESAHIGGWLAVYAPEGFKRYKSHTQGDAGEEVTVDNRGVAWKRPAVLVIPLAIVGLLMVPSFIGKTATANITPKAGSEAASGARSAPGRQAAVPVPPDTSAALLAEHSEDHTHPHEGETGEFGAPKESGRWSLIGVVQKASGSGIAMVESSTGRRRIDLDNCINDTIEWRCTIDGEVVTMWTGNGMLRLAQGATYTGKESQ